MNDNVELEEASNDCQFVVKSEAAVTACRLKDFNHCLLPY